jgi:hypothetical protein
MKNLVNYLEDYLDENEERHFKGNKINEQRKIKFKRHNKDE